MYLNCILPLVGLSCFLQTRPVNEGHHSSTAFIDRELSAPQWVVIAVVHRRTTILAKARTSDILRIFIYNWTLFQSMNIEILLSFQFFII